MTNALPAGTRNTSLNLIDDEYRIVMERTGKAGAFYKEWALKGLQAAGASGDAMAQAMAKQIESIRNERLRMKHGIVCLSVGLLVIGLSIFGIDQDMRRSRRGTRSAYARKDYASDADLWTPSPLDAHGPVTWNSITELS